MKITIPFILSKDFFPSVPAFDPCFIKAKEPAKVTEVILADKENPLYLVENAQGKSKAVHRRYLVEHGVIWG
jgi:hypothetical protein